MPRRGWWWARSTWWRRLPIWRGGRRRKRQQLPDGKSNGHRIAKPRATTRTVADASRTMADRRCCRIESDNRRGKAKQVVKQGLSEYFLFTIEGREDIKDKEPKRLVALKAVDVPLESIYKLSDRTGDQGFTKFYRFKNVKLLDDHGKEKKLPAMENLGLSPLPNGTVGSSRNTRTRIWPTSAAPRPSTCPSATAWKSTSAPTRTSPSAVA